MTEEQEEYLFAMSREVPFEERVPIAFSVVYGFDIENALGVLIDIIRTAHESDVWERLLTAFDMSEAFFQRRGTAYGGEKVLRELQKILDNHPDLSDDFLQVQELIKIYSELNKKNLPDEG